MVKACALWNLCASHLPDPDGQIVCSLVLHATTDLHGLVFNRHVIPFNNETLGSGSPPGELGWPGLGGVGQGVGGHMYVLACARCPAMCAAYVIPLDHTGWGNYAAQGTGHGRFACNNDGC